MNPILWVFIISFMPFIQLRVAIPTGIALGLPPLTTFLLATTSNIILIFILFPILDRIFEWKIVKKYADRAHKKAGKYIEKYGYPGLTLFVAIPLPITGAYTGSLVAHFLEMDRKKSILAIAIGVTIAGIIVTLASTSFLWLAKLFILK